MRKTFILWCIVSITYFHICATRKLIVRTTHGLVRGKLNYYNDLVYYSYQGIPYAENPSGILRFKPPIPKKPWKGIFNATSNGVVCPQWEMRYNHEEMSEDCLILNIYVPKTSVEQLPVLFFIHGGGFILLSGGPDYLYGPQFFLERQVIVVTLNFRVGPLGFLSLQMDEASGNAGIKDMILALRWINKNISRFGGNSNKITIGGHSSGASLVHCLLLTDKTDGLFQQAILISGNAINHRLFSYHPKDDALSLAKELGIESDDLQNVLQKLQKVDVFHMADAFKNLTDINKNVLSPCALFAPCVEKNFSHAVLTESPMQILKNSGLIQNVPILLGNNAQEGIYMVPTILKNPRAFEDLHIDNRLYIPSNLEYPNVSHEAKHLGNEISQVYFKSNDSETLSLDTLIELMTDIRYVYSDYTWLKLHKRNTKSNRSYFYNFDFDGDLNWSKLNYNIDYPGTAHADEMGYIFVTNRTINRIENASEESKNMINIICNFFSNFIKFGAPLQNNGIEWPTFDMKDQKYLVLSPKPVVKSLFDTCHSIRLEFWEKIYYKYDQYVKNGGEVENRCKLLN